jgi:hypothetical protein
MYNGVFIFEFIWQGIKFGQTFSKNIESPTICSESFNEKVICLSSVVAVDISRPASRSI